jgi:hypothetical protein
MNRVGNDGVTWTTVVVALAAGAIGTMLTLAVGFLARMLRIGREIEANDRALRILDDHLETWVSDQTIDLIRDVRATCEQLNKKGLLQSSEYGRQIGLLKETALHWYRDQERTAQSQADEIRAREGAVHGFVRAWRFKTLDIELKAPGRVLPILERWAEPPTRHLSATDTPQPLENDPRHRTVERTLELLDAKPDALT